MVEGGRNRSPESRVTVNEVRVNSNNLVTENFHDRIYEDYKRILFGDRNVLYKMKEIWFYIITMFLNSSKYEKKIKKSERFYDYEEAVNSLFCTEV